MTIQTTDWLLFENAASVSSTGDVTWLNPSNAIDGTTSNTRAQNLPSNGGTSEYLSCFEVDFTSPPPFGNVIGIELSVERRRDSQDGQVRFSEVYLHLDGAGGQQGDSQNKADPVDFPQVPQGTFTEVTFGGSEDSWGKTLTTSDIISSDFGCVFQVQNIDTKNPATADLRFVRIRFHIEETEIQLSANDISTSKPSLGTPNFGQVHTISAQGVSLLPVSVETVALGIISNLTAQSIGTSAPNTGVVDLNQSHTLSAIGFSTRRPRLGSPQIILENGAFSIFTGAPALDSPSINQIHNLSAQNLETIGISLGSPNILGITNLNAAPLTSGSPKVGQPIFSALVELTALGIFSKPPVVSNTTIAPGGPQFTTEIQGVFIGDREIETTWRRVDVN